MDGLAQVLRFDAVDEGHGWWLYRCGCCCGWVESGFVAALGVELVDRGLPDHEIVLVIFVKVELFPGGVCVFYRVLLAAVAAEGCVRVLLSPAYGLNLRCEVPLIGLC